MTEETNPPEDRLLTYSELAAKIGVSTSTLRRQVKKLRIPYVEMGHQIARFHYPTVLKYLHGLKSKP